MQRLNKLIFIAGSDKVILNLLEYVFQGKNGYEVKLFSSGEDCLINLSMNPDIIVLDYDLNKDNEDNKLSGPGLLQELSGSDTSPAIIILSGNTEAATVQEADSEKIKAIVMKDDFFVDHLENIFNSEFGKTPN